MGERDNCEVHISSNTTCYCDSSCVENGDCCSDARQICARAQGKIIYFLMKYLMKYTKIYQ